MKYTGLTSDERERYSRHLVLPEVGSEGQEKLKRSKVAIVGIGGLGSPVALYLAAAGVGTLGLVDFDHVSMSNLQRQILYTTKDIGRLKVEVAKEHLQASNPGISVVTHAERLTSSNAIEILGRYDLGVDCTDNFPTRYLINDASVLLDKYVVYGSVYRFEGQVSIFGRTNGPCYRCLYPEPPDPELVQDCSQSGVMGVVTGVVGCMQANEAIKTILGLEHTLRGRLLMLDALDAGVQEIAVLNNPDCPACGNSRSITSLVDYDSFCGSKARLDEPSDISVHSLKNRLQSGTPPSLLDVREEYERAICSLGGHFIPLRQLQSRLGELDPNEELVVYCHHGFRSGLATDFLRRAGFGRVQNLSGGIDAWAREIDSSMLRY